MTSPNRVTLYDPDGQPYSVRADNIVERNRLQAQGYSTDPPFDPSAAGVDVAAVLTHLESATDQEQARVLAAEARGKQRTAILTTALPTDPQPAGQAVEVPAAVRPARVRPSRATSQGRKSRPQADAAAATAVPVAADQGGVESSTPTT